MSDVCHSTSVHPHLLFLPLYMHRIFLTMVSGTAGCASTYDDERQIFPLILEWKYYPKTGGSWWSHSSQLDYVLSFCIIQHVERVPTTMRLKKTLCFRIPLGSMNTGLQCMYIFSHWGYIDAQKWSWIV